MKDPQEAICIFGTFDVDNYGDLLFPVIARWRLDENVNACSPTDNATSFRRGQQIDYLSYNQLDSVNPKAIIIGGGNILHFNTSNVFPYRSRPFCYAGLQLIPLLCKKQLGVPVIYNSPSIALGRVGPLDAYLYGLLFANADYLSFRDCASVAYAKRFTTGKVNYVPDTAFDISRAWPLDQRVRPLESDYIVVHVNRRYGGEACQVAAALDYLHCILDVKIVFLPMGPCHGDLEYAQQIARTMKLKPVLIESLDIYAFAQYIANSKMYIGSSMHGFITSVSYSVKAALVLNEKPMHKFAGALGAAGMTQDCCFISWMDAVRSLGEIKPISDDNKLRIFRRLDEHWQGINDAICSGKVMVSVSPSIYAWKWIVFLNQWLGSCIYALSSSIKVAKRYFKIV